MPLAPGDLVGLTCLAGTPCAERLIVLCSCRGHASWNLSPTQDLLTLTTCGGRLRSLVTDHLARTFMTVAATDDHPDLRLTLELNRRPPAEPEASPAPRW